MPCRQVVARRGAVGRATIFADLDTDPGGRGSGGNAGPAQRRPSSGRVERGPARHPARGERRPARRAQGRLREARPRFRRATLAGLRRAHDRRRRGHRPPCARRCAAASTGGRNGAVPSRPTKRVADPRGRSPAERLARPRIESCRHPGGSSPVPPGGSMVQDVLNRRTRKCLYHIVLAIG